MACQEHTCEKVHPCRAPQQVVVDAGAVVRHQCTAPIIVLRGNAQVTDRHIPAGPNQVLGKERGACVGEVSCV